MRPIKFRAWHKQERKMYEPSHIGVNGYRAVMSIYTGRTWYTEGFYPDEFELLQFIGLKDKNGKEIYEGDIVKWDTLEGVPLGHTYMQIVRWDDDGAMFLPNDMKDDVEIIGNIYENPELLQGEAR